LGQVSDFQSNACIKFWLLIDGRALKQAEITLRAPSLKSIDHIKIVDVIENDSVFPRRAVGQL
jgi:hypothetical protein